MISLPRLNRRAGEAVVVGLGRAGQMVGQIAAIRVSTSVLSPAQLGGVTQITAIGSLFSLAFITPVSMYIVRGFREWYDLGLLRPALRRFAWFVTGVAAVATVATALSQRYFAVVSGFTVAWAALLVGGYLIAQPLGALGTSGFNLLNRRVGFAVFANVPIWVGLLLSVVLFRVRPDAAFWVLGQCLAMAVACASLAMLPTYERASPSPPFEATMGTDAGAVGRFAWPVGLQAALWWVQSQAYRFILDKVASQADVGLFSIGYGLAATPVAIYEGLFSQFYEPIYYEQLRGQGQTGQAAAWENYARAYLPGLVPVGVFVTLSGPFMARVLLGDRFQMAAEVVVLAGLTELLRGTGAMMHHLGIAKLDNRIVLLPVLVGAVVAPLGVLFLAPLDPLKGTAAARLIAGIAVTIVIFQVSRRAMPISWPFREIWRAMVLCLPLAAGLVAAKVLWPTPTIVWSVLVLICAAICVVIVELKVLTVFREPVR